MVSKYPTVGAALDNTVNSQVYKPNTAATATNNEFSYTKGVAVDQVPVTNSHIEQPGFYKAGTYSSARDSSSYNFNNNV